MDYRNQVVGYLIVVVIVRMQLNARTVLERTFKYANGFWYGG